MKKLIVLLLLLFPLLLHAESYKRFNKITKYDKHFRKYSKRFFGPGFDWKHFKSQSIAESLLKKEAVSYVGAKGLMQIMPLTYQEIRRKNAFIKGSSLDPKWNIAAGISYDRQIWNMWSGRRPFQDRLDFTYASYNAGCGHILKAQEIADKKGYNQNLWASIVRFLHKVTGHHSLETIGYVKRIRKIKGDLN